MHPEMLRDKTDLERSRTQINLHLLQEEFRVQTPKARFHAEHANVIMITQSECDIMGVYSVIHSDRSTNITSRL